MGSAIIFSILAFTVVLPVWAARAADPARGLKRLVIWMCIANTLYLFAAAFVYPRL